MRRVLLAALVLLGACGSPTTAISNAPAAPHPCQLPQDVNAPDRAGLDRPPPNTPGVFGGLSGATFEAAPVSLETWTADLDYLAVVTIVGRDAARPRPARPADIAAGNSVVVVRDLRLRVDRSIIGDPSPCREAEVEGGFAPGRAHTPGGDVDNLDFNLEPWIPEVIHAGEQYLAASSPRTASDTISALYRIGPDRLAHVADNIAINVDTWTPPK